MTWLYSPSATGTEEPNSPSDPWAGYEPWLVLSATPTQRPSSWRGWKKRGWIALLCGIASKPSTVALGVAEWIASLPDSPANPSAPPDVAPELTTPAGSGRRSLASFATWDRDLCCWRTSPGLFDSGSPTSSPTLPRSGSMRNGGLLSAADVGATHKRQRLWLVAVANTDHADGRPRVPTTTRRDLSTQPERPSEAVVNPESVGGTRGSDPPHGDGGPSLKTQVLHSTDGLHARTMLADGKRGKPTVDLNPQFVASLMGLPKDWLTSYTLEETGSCHSVPQPHGPSSPTELSNR